LNKAAEQLKKDKVENPGEFKSDEIEMLKLVINVLKPFDELTKLVIYKF